MWAKLASMLGGKVADYFVKREDRKVKQVERKAALDDQKFQVELERIKGKAAWEAAKTRRSEQSEGRDHEWELESIRNSGWKDELVIVILSLGMVGAFVPGLAPYVLEGFEILNQTPEWYRWLVVMIYAATFGIRVWRRKL